MNLTNILSNEEIKTFKIYRVNPLVQSSRNNLKSEDLSMHTLVAKLRETKDACWQHSRSPVISYPKPQLPTNKHKQILGFPHSWLENCCPL